MRVLVTGSAGHIGREQVKVLLAAGHEIRTFDRIARKRSEDWEHFPGDLRDLDTVRKVVAGMDAVVHLGAIANDWKGAADQVLSINTQGTWNILLACVEAEVERVINFSSINALGVVGEHRKILHLPVQDTHPHRPMSPYQISKHLGEELCAMFSQRHGLITISLRPGWVATQEHYSRMRNADTLHSHHGASELWGYVDRRDVCEASRLALQVENIRHDAFMLFAAETTSKVPSVELAETHYPAMPWSVEPTTYFADNPYRSLFDCSHAAEVLGWTPRHSWRDESPAS